MAVRRVLTRLLRLRELEEEQSRIKLESAVGDRDRVHEDLARAAECLIQGRQSFTAGIVNRDALGRTGAVLETEQARKQRLRILPRLQAAEAEVMRQREEYLLRRTGRRQVETLVENEKGMAMVEAARRAQQMTIGMAGVAKQKARRRALSLVRCFPRTKLSRAGMRNPATAIPSLRKNPNNPILQLVFFP
jgi:flagellar export protein FliJ